MISKKILHIGFPKTGSTYLQKYFDAHPDIYHDRQRFDHYVRNGMVDEHLTECVDGFEFDVLSEELLSIWPGDDSELDFRRYDMNYDIKAKQRETAEGLKRLFPDAKVLIVVRGYESLIPSLYSQYLLGGGTDSFKKVVRTQQGLTLEMYDYDYTIRIYTELFGDDNVLILPFEYLSDDPAGFLNHVEEFFGFAHFSFPANRVHTSLNTHSVQIVRVMNFIALKIIGWVPKKQRKQKLLKYLEWLYNSKEGMNRLLKFGHELRPDPGELKTTDFHKNSTLVKFGAKLQRYESVYG